MIGLDDIVITGIGCVSPIGIGRTDLRDGLFEGRCATKQLVQLNDDDKTTYYGAEIEGFAGKQFVTPRKALKVMSREVQIAYAAAHLAWEDAGLVDATTNPDRLAVIYGSEVITGETNDILSAISKCSQNHEMDISRWGEVFPREIYPLWMLKNLPNMPACHVGIAIDARGPNNTISQEEVSGLLALSEGAGIIERGDADLVVVGGVGARVCPTRLAFRPADPYDQHAFDPNDSDSPRPTPFDSKRRGIVPSEAAAAIIVERRSHAAKRGANILAQLVGRGSSCGGPSQRFGGSREAITCAIQTAMREAEIGPDELAHVSAQGFSHSQLDIEEAQAIARTAGKAPVTAFSSYFGSSGAASGVLQLASSIISVCEGKTLPTLGTTSLDSDCPVRTVREVTATNKLHFLEISFTPHGHAATAIIKCSSQIS